MPNVGPLEIVVVLALVLIIFGPKRLPELGHSLGKGIREFRGSLSGENDEPPAAPPTIAAPANESVAENKPAPVAAQPVADQSADAKPSETSTGS